MKKTLFFLALSFFTIPFATASVSSPELKWSEGGCFSSWCETGWYSSPAIADLDGDGKNEVIASAYSIVVLDGETGELKWRVKSGHDRSEPDADNVGRTWPKIIIEDVDGDGNLEIVSAHGSGYVSVYSHDGYFESGWPQRPIERELRGLSVADIDGDSTMEIIVTGAHGSKVNTWVYEHSGLLRAGWPQLESEDGYAYGVFNDNASVGNLDNDSDLEILIPSDVHYICAYDPDGTMLPANSMYDSKGWGKVGIWESLEVELRGWGQCSGDRKERFRTNFAHGASVILDVDGNGTNEVVVIGNVYDCAHGHPPGKYNGVYIFNTDRSRFNSSGFNWDTFPVDTGAPLTEDYNVIENNQPNPVVVDLDGDGMKEILFSSYDGKVHAYWLDKTEHHSWPFSVYNSSEGVYRFASEPVVLDIENDGFAEIIFPSWVQKGSNKTGKLHVLDYTGSVLHEITLPIAKNGDWNGGLAAPAIGNIDSDSDYEIIINTAHSGFVAYDLPGSENARILWERGRTPGDVESGEIIHDNSSEYSFRDIMSYKYRESIQVLSDNEVVSGYGDGTYRPNNTINRAEFLKLLLTASGAEIDENKYFNCFPDVAAQWFAKYVCYGKEMMYVGGYHDGFFRPERNVSYVEALKILYEINGDAGKENPTGNEWYSQYLEDAESNGIGLSDLRQKPSHELTRGEMAEIIVRYQNVQ